MFSLPFYEAQLAERFWLECYVPKNSVGVNKLKTGFRHLPKIFLVSSQAEAAGTGCPELRQ